MKLITVGEVKEALKNIDDDTVVFLAIKKDIIHDGNHALNYIELKTPVERQDGIDLVVFEAVDT